MGEGGDGWRCCHICEERSGNVDEDVTKGVVMKGTCEETCGKVHTGMKKGVAIKTQM